MDKKSRDGIDSPIMDPAFEPEALQVEREPWHKIAIRKDYTILSGREELGRILGLTASEDLRDVFDAEAQGRITGLMADLRPGGIAQAIVIARGGISLEIILINRGEASDLLFRNVTGSIAAQERLAVLYRHFLTTPIAIAITDPEGAIVDVNRSFLNLYGYGLETP